MLFISWMAWKRAFCCFYPRNLRAIEKNKTRKKE